MLKKCLVVILFVFVLSCPVFAYNWDGIMYKLQTKDITDPATELWTRG